MSIPQPIAGIGSRAKHRFWTRRGWMGRAITVSVLLHLGLLFVSGFVIASRAFSKPEVQFEIPSQVQPKLEPQKLELKARVRDLQKSGARPQLLSRMSIPRETGVALPDIKKLPKFTNQKLPREMASFGVPNVGYGMVSGIGAVRGGGLAAGDLPSFAAGRCDANERLKRLTARGGKPQCEKAVLDALVWLQQHQNPNGSWGHSYPTAMTGLAILTYLGHCELPGTPQFGATVTKAIKYLQHEGAENDGRLTATAGNTYPYQHAIGTFALAEAYSLTHDPELAPVVQKAAALIVKHQTTEGGWEYDYIKNGNDTSVTAWQMQALKAVYYSGLKVDGFENCIERALDCVREMQDSDGGNWKYKISAPGIHPSLTGAGTLSLVLWGSRYHTAITKGFGAILKDAPTKYDDAGTNFYSWYYTTLATFLYGGTPWNHWNQIFQDELLRNQSADGSWPAEGGGVTAKQAGADSMIYRTSLCALMLEVYYRYLPTGSATDPSHH